MAREPVTRRAFLRNAAVTTGAGLVGARAATAGASRGPRRSGPARVAVLGGGVAGLTAAHELAERGFAVTVYEARAFGGKARSFGVPGTAQGGRRPLPAEHGMRFFPGFYANLPDTLRRIPDRTNPNGVFDNLVAAPQLELARDRGREDPVFPLTPDPRPWTPEQMRDNLIAAFEEGMHLPPDETAHFVGRMMVYLSSCDARRLGQWEQTSWWDFMDASRFSEDYQRLLVSGITRQLLAARASMASARTLGTLYEAFLYNLTGREGTGSFDRLLDAPTSEAWIEPWLRHLRRLGVDLRLGCAVTGLSMRDGRIAAATVRRRQQQEVVRADWFVCALPAERATRLWTPRLLAADPRLAAMAALQTAWMNGIQFYLRRPAPLVRGHILYLDSPWALSSLSQGQFWSERVFARDYGDGRARDCLSVDIGDFTEPGVVYGRAARELEPKQIAREVWEQMKRHLDDTGDQQLTDDLVVRWQLDPGLRFGRRGGRRVPVRSDDPLLINTPGSWTLRPPAATAVPNLVLASDYVQVGMDLACMEGANEAARRAVNALLEASGSPQARCSTFSLYRPPEWEAFKAADEQRYRSGQPNLFDESHSSR